MPVKKARASAKKGPFARKHYNYGRWTKGRFSEAVTVTGPAKMIFLAGIGSEHEQTGKILHPGDFDAQCRYAFLKMKKVLAKNGARLADVVKQVTYVTDARYVGQAGERRREAYCEAALPAHTFVNVSQLAWPDMMVEFDIIAMVPHSES
jgi:enamine deaminase RidA (YjgF/YER057c/UK114 family)